MNPVLSKHPLWCFAILPPLLQPFLVRISSELERAFMVENSVGKKISFKCLRENIFTKVFGKMCKTREKSRGSLNKCAKN